MLPQARNPPRSDGRSARRDASEGTTPTIVTTTLKGLDNLGGTVSVTDVIPQSSTPDYILVPVNARFNNPSNITILIRDVYAPIWHQDVDVGRAYIETVDVTPGNNTVLFCRFHCQPINPNDLSAQELFALYIGTYQNGTRSNNLPNIVPSLVQGLQLRTSTSKRHTTRPFRPCRVYFGFSVTGMGERLVLEIDLKIPALSALLDSTGYATLTFRNPVKPDLCIKTISTNVFKSGFENGQSSSAVRSTVIKNVDPPTRLPGNNRTDTLEIRFTLTDGLLFRLTCTLPACRLFVPLERVSRVVIRSLEIHTLTTFFYSIRDIFETYLRRFRV